MAASLSERCEECREALLAAILDALRGRADYIAAIERTGRGVLSATGIALELFPWRAAFGLSLRLASDYPLGRARYDSADWPHYDFTAGYISAAITDAIALVTEIYAHGNAPDNDLRDMAHLTFLAGAEALLHPRVCQLLNELEIRAPELSDAFVGSPFQYIVTDADGTLKSNYCDVVLADRIRRRLLGGR